MTCDDCDLSLETVTKIEKEIAEHAPVPNLMVKYGVYQDIDKSLPVSVICDRGFMAIRSIRDNYECNIAYYTEKMKQKQMQDRLLENRFESAIKNKEFVAYFQPKYDVKTEKITGAESLVRWINPDGSMVMPGDFIPLYEKDGLIVKLDEYIFRYVCEFQRELMEKGQELIPISVNLSRTSLHHSDIVERYMKIVEENGIPFSCVPVELTETATLNNVMIRDFTEKLVNSGFSLHMDDFGSGYSSLITLSELPFNTLKIDKSLIDCIHQHKGKMVVQQIIILAHGLGMKVVAEGVETADQVKLLKEMECDNIQGFYYSRPLPVAEFVKQLKENR
ncbi:MAG: EAL domain-containing protein [Blautia wexlerae]